ncbi:MAG TPA: arylsulfotransferase family protein [Polyangia bacterium]|nr:arylsulfotransferase family protein [Polyangia bacterium]
MHRPPFLRPRSRLVAVALGGGFLALVAGRPATAADPAPLAPPPITVLTSKPGLDRGLIFVAPKQTPPTATQEGPEIIDNQGRPIWFHAVGPNDQGANFRVQQYRGQPVLTWWEGTDNPNSPGEGQGVNYVLDSSYHQIAVVAAGNGYQADLHEFRITPRGTAFITIYNHIPYDLSSVGGPQSGIVIDGVAQEVDVKTGKVVWEWHSIDHVPLSESQAAPPAPTATTTPYDYFHINAINWDEDGNIIIDARNTWTAYKVDYRTKEIVWRQGGKSSTFPLTTGDGGTQTAWQHDPEPVDRHTIRIFDNEAAPSVLPYSRVVWIERDLHSKTSKVVKQIIHPDKIQAGSQGNSQALDHDHTFVGWGATGRFSEFDRDGNLLFDAAVPPNAAWDTYRAYRFEWHGTPDTKPTATATATGEGSITVHAIWNGATDVARWIVVAGKHPGALWPAGSADWNGLDTTITVTSQASQIAVIAQGKDGRILGRSAAVAVSTGN